MKKFRETVAGPPFLETFFTVEAIRAAEARVLESTADGELMARAAFGLATHTVRLLHQRGVRLPGARVVVLAGTGNNGGDALFAGALLAARGARVRALRLAGPAHADGEQALRRAHGQVVELHGQAFSGDHAQLLSGADVVLDGVVGLGGRPGLRGLARDSARVLNALPADQRPLVVAVDLPSGIDPDTGEVAQDGGESALRADHTVTFGAAKPGLVLYPGSSYAGRVHLVDIGLDLTGVNPVVRVARDAEVAAWLPQLAVDATKYSRGVLGLLAGSPAYPGAAVLAAGGALATGVGMLRAVADGEVASLLLAAHPEVVVTPCADLPQLVADRRVTAWVCGPGLGGGAPTAQALTRVLATDAPVVLDADALTVLAGDPLVAQTVRQRRPATVLTPHAGEMARLLGPDGPAASTVSRQVLRSAREAADRYQATVLLKGPTSVVVSPGPGVVWVNSTGTPRLATAGSGDVLAGMIGALLAAGLSAQRAATAAAHLHGQAAHPGRGTVWASSLVDTVRLLPGLGFPDELGGGAIAGCG